MRNHGHMGVPPDRKLTSPGRWRPGRILLELYLDINRIWLDHRKHGRDGINGADERWTVPLGFGICAGELSKVFELYHWMAFCHVIPSWQRFWVLSCRDYHTMSGDGQLPGIYGSELAEYHVCAGRCCCIWDLQYLVFEILPSSEQPLHGATYYGIRGGSCSSLGIGASSTSK